MYILRVPTYNGKRRKGLSLGTLKTYFLIGIRRLQFISVWSPQNEVAIRGCSTNTVRPYDWFIDYHFLFNSKKEWLKIYLNIGLSMTCTFTYSEESTKRQQCWISWVPQSNGSKRLAKIWLYWLEVIYIVNYCIIPACSNYELHQYIILIICRCVRSIYRMGSNQYFPS